MSLPIEQARKVIEAARAKVRALCSGKETWTMTVPVRKDYDHDLVICDGLDAGAAALDALEALRGEYEKLERLAKRAEKKLPFSDPVGMNLRAHLSKARAR